MKKLLFLLTLIGLGYYTPAQNFEWAKRMGGGSIDIGYSITVDSAGNVYTAGYFQGTVDFDPGAGFVYLTSAGSDDIFVSKLDASGNFVWAKNMGGTSGDRGYSISLDASGNVYTIGYFSDIADFDPGAGSVNLTSAGSTDIFVSKLDASGNFVWVKRMGGIGVDLGNSIAVDGSGNVYTTGIFEGTVDFDPGTGTADLVTAGLDDIFVSKLDASGNFVWAKNMGGTITDQGYGIVVDDSGNVYTTGVFTGTTDFDPGAGTANLTSAGNWDIFVSKLDASGNFVWAKNMGGTSTDRGNSIAVDSSGNVYTTGYFYGTTDFDPGAGIVNLTSAGSADIFVSKLDASGNFVWAKKLGVLSDDYGISIAIDSSGNIYTTGKFQGTVDFDPGAGTVNLTSAGSIDIFVSKLDASGNFVWAKNMGGTGSDLGNSIAVDAARNVYTTGKFTGTADFDPGAGTINLTSAGSDDVFVSKLSQCVSTIGTDIQTACDSLTWIDGNIYISNTNTPVFTIINGAVSGCDSLVILNLTINATSSTDVQTACDSLTWIDGITYTSSTSIPTLTLANAAGCDSVVALNLTITTIDNTTSLNTDTITANETVAIYRWLNCDSNNVVIAGATAQNFTPSATGNYAVEITVGACIDTSACINVIITNIEELTPTGIKIYPNPINDKIVIELANFSPKTQLNIVSIEGKTVYTNNTINTNKVVVDAADWSKGVYFVTVINDISSNTLKLIKE